MPLSSHRDFEAALAFAASSTEHTMDRLLPKGDSDEARVFEAMRYSSLGGGKRLRAFFVLAGATLFKVAALPALRTASAIEFVHAYSLIHDDLPAMDDDDYRRGRLTNHKVFGEAMAILAGDALLTLAFRLIADNASRMNEPRMIARVVADVADAAGTDGMVGGQVVDIESEGKDVGPDTLEYIHRHKTAALIRVSLTAGATLAGGRPEQLAAIRAAGESLGLAFQIVDDILDVEGSLAELGKSAGSDERKKKATYPAIHGLDVSKQKARTLIDETKRLLEPLGAPALPIRALADFVLERRS